MLSLVELTRKKSLTSLTWTRIKDPSCDPKLVAKRVSLLAKLHDVLVHGRTVVGQRVNDQVDFAGTDLGRHLGQYVPGEVVHAVMVEAGEVDHGQDAAKSF